MTGEVGILLLKACLKKESGPKELSLKMNLIVTSKRIVCLTRMPLQLRRKEKTETTEKRVYANSPGIPDSSAVQQRAHVKDSYVKAENVG